MSTPTPTQLRLSGIMGGISAVASNISKILSLSSFRNNTSIDDINNMNTGQVIIYFMILIFLIYLTMWIGTFIFNTSVVKIFPSIKKINTLDFFGLYIVLHLLFC